MNLTSLLSSFKGPKIFTCIRNKTTNDIKTPQNLTKFLNFPILLKSDMATLFFI